MSGHTPWSKIKHKRDERKAAEKKAKTESVQKMLSVTIEDLLLEQLHKDYGLHYETFRGHDFWCYIWRCHPWDGPGSKVYHSEQINFKDFEYEKKLYHHERVGLFGGTAFEAGTIKHFSVESFERAARQEFWRSMREAAHELRGLVLDIRPEELYDRIDRSFDRNPNW